MFKTILEWKFNLRSTSKDFKADVINYLDTSSLTSNQMTELQKIDTKQDPIPSRAQRVVNKNDILYSTVRPNQCHFGIVKIPKNNMIASTGFAQMTSIVDDIKNEFIYLFLSSETIVNRLHQIASSAVSAYPSVSPNDILDLQIALPNELRLLKVISDFLEPIFLKIAKKQQENQQLAILRDWLLPMLMNGQIKVK